MRSPQTVPLVIQHRHLANSSRPAQSIPIPSRAGHDLQLGRHSPAQGPGVHDGGETGDVDMEVDEAAYGSDSPPSLTTGQSLDDGDYLLTPPSQLLFGPMAPLHVAEGSKAIHAEGKVVNKEKSRSDVKITGDGRSLLLQTPPEVRSDTMLMRLPRGAVC